MNLEEAIRHRRTVKPERFTGEVIPDRDVWKILESANWAPTHGHTEPWRFSVFTGSSKQELLDFLNKLTVKVTGFNPVKEEKRSKRFAPTSHIISIGMKRGDNPKIPEVEELLAVAMAVQNMWLTAHAMGYGGYWSTGALAFTDELRDFIGLSENDRSLGFFYLGVPVKGIPDGHRFSKIEDKVNWHRSI